jgi:hypothetical protein
LPGKVEPFLLVLIDSAFGCAHQIKRLPFRRPHLFENRFARYAAIHHPDAPRFAVRRFDLGQKIAQG